MTLEKITTRDFSDEFIDSISVDLASYSVGIFSINENGVDALGSGTLVQYEDIYGVVTARHVVELFETIEKVGLVLHKREHRFVLEVQFLDLIVSDRGKTLESGPDMAFIRLPKAKVGTIKARCSFVNLGIHKERVVKSSYGHDFGCWCLFGFPDEMRSTYKEEGKISFEFYGQCGVSGGMEKYSDEGQYDYFWQKIVYSKTNNPPQSYGGVSGGGLWQAIITSRKGKYEVSEYIFRGVAFYQTSREGDTRLIKFHGDKSVYTYMLGEIQKRYS